ncbi:MAG: hypothetical protein JXB88_08415 [Spirochaetales bacterium]|nr:hypothetical protein [Spirochaetales bacterium]
MENKEKNNPGFKFDQIKFFPISFLAICLGLIGFTLAWQKAEQILRLPLFFFKAASWVIFVVFNSIILLLIIKTIFAIKNKRICIEDVD